MFVGQVLTILNIELYVNVSDETPFIAKALQMANGNEYKILAVDADGDVVKVSKVGSDTVIGVSDITDDNGFAINSVVLFIQDDIDTGVISVSYIETPEMAEERSIALRLVDLMRQRKALKAEINRLLGE